MTNNREDFYVWGWGKYHNEWYINFRKGSTYDGVSGKTLKECLSKIGITRSDLGRYNRYDL